MKINIEGKREIPNKRWLDAIESYMKAVGVCVVDVENRDEWRFRTRVADHNSWEKGKGEEDGILVN
jgi:hypothetical protein